MRILLVALFSCFIAYSSNAQSLTEIAVSDYVASYNEGKPSSQHATVIHKPVTITKTKENKLVATINGVSSHNISLDRETPAQLDEVLPLTIEKATVVLAGSTCLILDLGGERHYAFTVEDEPELPVIKDEKVFVFYGYGLGRAWRNTSGR